MATLGQILPLLILLTVVAALGFVGYHIYLTSLKIGESAGEKMARKNIAFNKDGTGLMWGIKDRTNEQYVDRTQSWVFKAWKLSTGETTEGKRRKRKDK